jgi:hypothetical protein
VVRTRPEPETKMNDYTDHGCDPRELADEMDAYYQDEAAEVSYAAYVASLPTADEVKAAANGEPLPF